MEQDKEKAGAVEPIVSTRRMASFSITPELIAQALHMPSTTKIRGAEWDFTSDALRVYVEGPQFPEVRWGDRVIDIRPAISVEEINGERIYSWNWKC